MRDSDCTVQTRIAVLFGGRGCERSVSLKSAGNFIRLASNEGYRILPIFIAEDGSYSIYRGELSDIPDAIHVDCLEAAYPVLFKGISGFMTERGIQTVDFAAIIMHGDFGEDGIIQGALDSAGIRYISSSVSSSAACADKYFAKCVCRECKIPTLPSVLLNVGSNSSSAELAEYLLTRLECPIFVKPSGLGSSVGASAAGCREELAAAIERARSFGGRVIAEPCLCRKRELEVAYYSDGKRTVITEPSEISVPDGFYSYVEKYSDSSAAKLTVRADVGDDVKRVLKEYTERLAAALGVRHFARFDYFLTDGGEIYFNEVNTIPGMTDKSMFLSMLAEAGIGFRDMLDGLIGDICL